MKYEIVDYDIKYKYDLDNMVDSKYYVLIDEVEYEFRLCYFNKVICVRLSDKNYEIIGNFNEMEPVKIDFDLNSDLILLYNNEDIKQYGDIVINNFLKYEFENHWLITIIKINTTDDNVF